MFGRGPNGLINYSGESGVVAEPDIIQKRLEYLTRIVFPAIFEKTSRKHEKRNFKFLKNNRIVYEEFAPGAMVMVRDELRKSKSSPGMKGLSRFLAEQQVELMN
jgi:hypothetical protein